MRKQSDVAWITATVAIVAFCVMIFMHHQERKLLGMQHELIMGQAKIIKKQKKFINTLVELTNKQRRLIKLMRENRRGDYNGF